MSGVLPSLLYVFIDESGTFDFKPMRSKYFILTAVATVDPLQGCNELLKLRHDVLATSLSRLPVQRPHDYAGFHCTEDPQRIRNDVFNIVHFHPSVSHHMLQVSDYVGWAIFRKYEGGDTRSYALVKPTIRMEFDMFRKGITTYY